MIFYYLSTCNTCQKILKEINAKNLVLQDIKQHPVDEVQLNEMYQLAGSFEALFSRKAIKYRQLGLNEKQLTEKDYQKYLLMDYTFLKRPVAIVKGKIYIGNTKANIESLKAALQGE